LTFRIIAVYLWKLYGLPLFVAVVLFPSSTCPAVFSCHCDCARLDASTSGKRRSHPSRGRRSSESRDPRLPVPPATAADVRDLKPEMHFTYFRQAAIDYLSAAWVRGGRGIASYVRRNGIYSLSIICTGFILILWFSGSRSIRNPFFIISLPNCHMAELGWWSVWRGGAEISQSICYRM